MITVILRGVLGRKLRAVLTAIAIVLGVAMISGTYVLMDTTMRALDQVFETAYSKTDASVLGKTPFSATEAVPPPVSAALVEPIRGLPEVEEAEGFIQDSAQLRNERGEALTGFGVPLAFGIATGSQLNPLEMIAGREPAGADEIALDEKTAKKNDFRIGSRIGVAARGPLEWFRVVGLFRFGGVESLGPMQMMVFDLPVAQRIFDKQGLYDGIDVRARDRVTASELTAAIAPLLPATAEVKTREEQVDASTSAVGEGIAIVRYLLLAFGAVALFVGSFVIFNTLSITVAQRMRELATLRTIGASRGQVLASVLLEGALIGALASLIGLAGGLALAKALDGLFTSAGLELPKAGIVLAWRTVAVSLAAGMLVTLAATLLPAMRATRVPPIAAVREGAVLPPSRLGRATDVLAGAAILTGTAVLALTAAAGGLATVPRLLLLATGAVLLFFGLAPFSRRLVPPLSFALGKPIEAVTGAAGALARENSKRDPGRTAVTAAALTVGLALVAFVAVLGHGLRTTVRDAVERQVRADYVIRADQALMTPAVGRALRGGPVLAAASVRAGNVHAFDKTRLLTGVNPALISRFYRFEWAADSTGAALRRLDASGVIVRDDVARANNLRQAARARRPRHLRGAHLRPAPRGDDGLHAALRPRLPHPERPRRLCRHRRSDRRPRVGGEVAPRRLPEREGAHARRVHRLAAGVDRDTRQPLLRAARALGRDQPVRDRQHARPLDRRAHARDRRPARDRDDARAADADDPRRERDHRAHRCGGRHRLGDRPRRAHDAGTRQLGSQLQHPLGHAARARDRGLCRRPAGRDLPRPPGRAPRPAEGAPL